MVLFDTDHLTLFQRRGPEYAQLSARLSQYTSDEIATTIISYEEQTRGWMAYMARTHTVAHQIDAYERLLRHIENFRTIVVVPFDAGAAVEFQRLQKLRL